MINKNLYAKIFIQTKTKIKTKIKDMQNTQNNNELIDILGSIELPEEILEEKKEILKEENIQEEAKQEKLITTIFFVEINSKKELINELEKDYKNFEKTQKNIFFHKKLIKQFLSAAIFWIKYITTSVFIFWVLLVTTNFSAYYNIVESYLFESETTKQASSLLNSAEASNIKIDKQEKKEKRKINKKVILKDNDLKAEKITNKFSIKQLINSWEKDIDLGIHIVPYENRLVIPKIGKNVPLIDVKEKKVESENKLDNILMKELEFGVVRYPWSARPWQNWNSFIFGHSSNYPWVAWDYNDVFARLGQLKAWDTIFAYYWQKKYKYEVVSKKVVSPKEVWVLKNDKSKKQLTLMTCWPIWTTLNRLIVTTKLVEQD